MNKKGGFQKGHSVPQSWRDKISKTREGIVFSEKHIENLSISHKGKTGEKSSNWRGGKSFEKYPIDWTITLKKAIRQRDNYICQVCGETGNIVHHKNYNKKDCSLDNFM